MNDTLSGHLAPAAAQAARPRPPSRGRLFRKYVALFVAVVAVALVANGGFEIWFSYRDHEASLIRLQHEQAMTAAAKIGAFVTEIQGQLGWTTELAWSAATLEQRRFDALRLLHQVPAITELSQLDATGHEQLRVSRLELDAVGSNKDYSHDPRFTEAMAHKVYFGPVYFRRESEPYMTLALAGARKDDGVSVAEVNLKFIWDVISQIKVGERGFAFVVDGNGRLIAHPDISLVLRNTNLAPLPQVQAARAAMAGAQPGKLTFARDMQGRRMLSAYAPIEPLPWLVFVELPLAEAYAPLYASIARAGGLLAGCLVLAFLAGLFLARRMVGPIQAIRAGAARVGGGDLTQRIAIKTGDELETLADQFNDMTGRLQESYANLERKVADRTRELSQALEQQTATSEVLRVISSSPGELAPVFDVILANAMKICEASHGILFRIADDTLSAAAYRGLPAGLAARMAAGPFRPRPETPAIEMTRTRQTVQVADLRETRSYKDQDAAVIAAVELGGVRTVAFVPLMKDGDVIGAINVHRRDVQRFSDKQIALLESFAAQAVIAIENARLLTELRRRTADLQESLDYQTATSDVLKVISRSTFDLDPVLQTVVTTAVRLCRAEYAVIFRNYGEDYRWAAGYGLLPEYDRMERATHIRPGPGTVVGRAALEGRTVQIADAWTDPLYEAKDEARAGNVRSMLGVPLMRENTVIGVLGLARGTIEPFGEREIQLVTTFADQAVIAIENARLFGELRQRTDDLARSVEELKALGEISQAVNSTLELQTVLTTIVTTAVEISAADAGAIYVFDDAALAFHLSATHGMDAAMIEAIERQRIDAGLTVIGDAAARRAPVQIADLSAEPANPITDIVLRAGFRALLVMPLLRPDRIIGALVVRRREPGAFARTTVDLLETFAAQSVLAIQNARLFHEIEEKGRELAVASQHKSQFLANMSHELRTPMNAILGYTELILDDIYGAAPPKMRDVLARVQVNGKHLLGLINDVLDLSKIEAGQLSLALAPYSIKELVQGVYVAVEPLAGMKSLALKLDVAADLPPALGDERRIAQVLLNLVGNAIKFTDAGEVVIGARAADGAVTIAVHDTGPGIAAADQAKIFEEFQQADNSSTRTKGGTGLGLAISRRIVEMHGGRLWVESAPGAGSTFFFTLPITVERQGVSA